MHWQNWSGLESAEPRSVSSPASTEAVVAAVRSARDARSTVKMVGTGHSFTGIAAPGDVMLSRIDRRRYQTTTAVAARPDTTLATYNPPKPPSITPTIAAVAVVFIVIAATTFTLFAIFGNLMRFLGADPAILEKNKAA